MTLRRHYSGRASVLHDNDIPEWLAAILSSLNCQLLRIPDIQEGAFVKKTECMLISPYKLSVFIDADTVVLADPSPLFGLAEKHEFCCTQFSNWVTTGPKVKNRIMAWADLITPEQLDAALNFGAAINSGVLAFKKGSEIIKLWPEWTRLGAKDRRTPQVADEVPLHIICPQHPCHVLPSVWNYSVKHEVHPLSEAKIVHYHGRKHVANFPPCRLWKDAYRDLLAAFPQWRAELTQDYGDRRLKPYLRAQQREERRKHPVTVLTTANGLKLGKITEPSTWALKEPLPDMTIVTAVSAGKYVEKLRRNLPLWMNMANLNVQNFIVFSVNMDLHDMTLDFAREYPNVKVIPWFYKGISPRENAFSAFVFGTAQYVQTNYWMKLDADAKPIVGVFDWPDYKPYAIVSSPWGYSRNKGDAVNTKHWLNMLDDAWIKLHPDAQPIFPPDLDPHKNYRHHRLASFCSIERTEFTRDVAKFCEQATGEQRMIVPSHDTLVSVLADRMNAPVRKLKFKRWFRP